MYCTFRRSTLYIGILDAIYISVGAVTLVLMCDTNVGTTCQHRARTQESDTVTCHATRGARGRLERSALPLAAAPRLPCVSPCVLGCMLGRERMRERDLARRAILRVHRACTSAIPIGSSVVEPSRRRSRRVTRTSDNSLYHCICHLKLTKLQWPRPILVV